MSEQNNIFNKIPKLDLKCKCCEGTGVQRRAPDGVKIYCPACKGSGECPTVNQNIKFPNHQEYKQNTDFGPNTLIC